MLTRTGLLGALVLALLVVGCASTGTSPTLPPNAILLYHGPIGDMSVSGPHKASAGTIYVVDASNGKVVFAAYGEEGVTSRAQTTTSGLKKGHTYTFYFVPSNN